MHQISQDKLIPPGFTFAFLETVCNLIEYYLLRQQLVVLAMIDHNPRKLYESVNIDLAPYIDLYKRRHQAIREKREHTELIREDLVPIWKGDWECFAHGNGCRLTHIRTKEPIEWDATDQRAFDVHWFLNHLKWRLQNEQTDPHVRSCSEWLSTQDADIKVVQKAIYRLIDLDVLVVKSYPKCKFSSEMTRNHNFDLQLPKSVILALVNTLKHYRQKQDIAMQAIVDLCPDLIANTVNDPYTLPDVANRLSVVIASVGHLPEKRRNIQTGVWRDYWHYDIRYGTCALTHSKTDEVIRWTVTDPLLIEEYGYINHLNWRIQNGEHDEHIAYINEWLQTIEPTIGYDSNNVINTWHKLMYALINIGMLKIREKKIPLLELNENIIDERLSAT